MLLFFDDNIGPAAYCVIKYFDGKSTANVLIRVTNLVFLTLQNKFE